MLTHRNIVSNAAATRCSTSQQPDDVALSFLPLSHSFERTVIYGYLMSGVTIVFAENLDTIARDLRATSPTLMTVVPRVCEKLQARVLAGRSGVGAAALAVPAGRSARAVDRAPRRRGRTPWRRPAGRTRLGRPARVRQGARARSAAGCASSCPAARRCSARSAEFFLAAGLPLFEGYGLTETAPALAVNHPGAPRLGTVGPAIPGVELRIAEDGEILARGPNVMRGYWNRPGRPPR